jgi:G:T-mismatch repair DNA endonuclease (very short patch repair protein)
VFIDGDFWHGNPKKFRIPKSNCDYWEAKIMGNRKRDSSDQQGAEAARMARDPLLGVIAWRRGRRNRQTEASDLRASTSPCPIAVTVPRPARN